MPTARPDPLARPTPGNLLVRCGRGGRLLDHRSLGRSRSRARHRPMSHLPPPRAAMPAAEHLTRADGEGEQRAAAVRGAGRAAPLPSPGMPGSGWPSGRSCAVDSTELMSMIALPQAGTSWADSTPVRASPPSTVRAALRSGPSSSSVAVADVVGAWRAAASPTSGSCLATCRGRTSRLRAACAVSGTHRIRRDRADRDRPADLRRRRPFGL